MVEVSLDNTVWYGADDSRFSFTVKPPFWQRWWFILLSIITLLAAIYAIFRARLAALQRAKIRLEEEVRKATREILEKNEELEAQKNEIEAQRDLVMEQRDQIANQQQELQASIRYALRIQTAVLTPQSEMKQLMQDYFILNLPRDIVSGDFYWVAEKSDHVFFAVADSTGHGVPGAFMSMLGVSAFNEVLATIDCGSKANEFLFHLREHVKKALHHSDSEKQPPDGMDVAMCILSRKKNLLSIAGANNPVYHVRDNQLTEFKADKMPIAIHSRDKEHFTEQIIAVQPGDMVYLFSDGFADQFGGTEGKKFKYLAFKQILTEISQKSTHEQEELLRQTITGWMGTFEQIDDILVMGVRF
jgi:serine phosphatase RsbU (regulator of sigma subunit)